MFFGGAAFNCKSAKRAVLTPEKFLNPCQKHNFLYIVSVQSKDLCLRLIEYWSILY